MLAGSPCEVRKEVQRLRMSRALINKRSNTQVLQDLSKIPLQTLAYSAWLKQTNVQTLASDASIFYEIHRRADAVKCTVGCEQGYRYKFIFANERNALNKKTFH